MFTYKQALHSEGFQFVGTSESVEAFVHNAMELSYMAATATITKGLQNEALNDARDGLRVILED